MTIAGYRKQIRILEAEKRGIEEELSSEFGKLLTEWLIKVGYEHNAYVKQINIDMIDITDLAGKVDYVMNNCEVKI